MRLSVNRANMMVNYVFSRGFGDFPFKSEFRSLVGVGGMGLSAPIAEEGSDFFSLSQNSSLLSFISEKASPLLGPCGLYDCEKSRRVEIGFRLREDISGLKGSFLTQEKK